MRPDGVLKMRCPPSPFETLAIARGRRAWSRLRLAPQAEGGPQTTRLRHVGWATAASPLPTRRNERLARKGNAIISFRHTTMSSCQPRPSAWADFLDSAQL